MTLTYKLDLDILPLDIHANFQVVCLSVQLGEWDRQTDTQTDDTKTITPVTSEMWGVIMFKK